MLQPSVPAWFEIPVRDLDRAQRFYEGLLDAKLKREPFQSENISVDQAIFPYSGAAQDTSGALVRWDGVYAPSDSGAVVYLNVADLQPLLERAPALGGDVLLPPQTLPGVGTFAQIRDSEGNRVGLFAANTGART